MFNFINYLDVGVFGVRNLSSSVSDKHLMGPSMSVCRILATIYPTVWTQFCKTGGFKSTLCFTTMGPQLALVKIHIFAQTMASDLICSRITWNVTKVSVSIREATICSTWRASVLIKSSLIQFYCKMRLSTTGLLAEAFIVLLGVSRRIQG
jgi:hypothetical protein